jgi:translation initiation factor 2A
LHTNGVNSVRVDLDKEGPVHDVSWGSESEFGVVYGYMPAKTTLYDTRANAIQTISTGPRNTIKFSPGARFVLVAGFGNLAGTMDVFARKGKMWERMATMEASNSSVCEWSPDEMYVLTGTLSPRLRVDNGLRVWWVGGKLVYKEEINELYQVSPAF